MKLNLRNGALGVGAGLLTFAGAAFADLPAGVSTALTDAGANAILIWTGLIAVCVGVLPFVMGMKGLKKTPRAM